MQAKVGDTVRYLNAVGGGRLVRIEGQMAYVDEDGFETPVLLKECVPVLSDKYFIEPPKDDTPVVPAGKQKPAPDSKATNQEEAEELPFVETPAGERLNIVLGFESRDLRRLSTAGIDAYLVNDSNYYLYFSLLSRAEESSKWTTQFAGMVEPGIQLLCGEFTPDSLPQLDHLAIQYLAFKKKGEFDLKQPASVELKVDTTKFVKLHCYKSNPYFETPVIAFDITTDDKISKPAPTADPELIRQAMQAKTRIDKSRPETKRGNSNAKAKPGQTVVDLHASALLDNQRGLSAADILNYQVDQFRSVMDANLRNYGHKIIFIHGKGDGVLRQALLKELNHRYKGHDVQDASFREYGYGATQVTIRQHTKQ